MAQRLRTKVDQPWCAKREPCWRGVGWYASGAWNCGTTKVQAGSMQSLQGGLSTRYLQ